MDRALRRFYARRWKERTRKRMECWGWWVTPRTVGINSKARKSCSSYCCGSRRKYEGVTWRERRQLLDMKDQMTENGL